MAIRKTRQEACENGVYVSAKIPLEVKKELDERYAEFVAETSFSGCIEVFYGGALMAGASAFKEMK